MRGQSAASKRYIRRFIPTMTSYIVLLFGANWALSSWHPQGALLVLLAVLPALPIVAVIAVMGLYVVEETDEYQRQLIVSAMLGGLAIMLGLASVWGFLEEAEVAPHLPAYWAFVIWCAAWGLSQCVLVLRDRMAGAGE